MPNPNDPSVDREVVRGLSTVDGRVVNLHLNDDGTITATLASGTTVDVTDRAGRLLGHVTVDNASLAVTGPVTDVQLRAVPVVVSGTVTTGGLTDTQLRATAVPVSGTVNPSTPSLLAAFITPVPTAGTRVQLANHPVTAGILQAPSTNTGLVYVGDITVSATVYGAELQPGQATGIATDNTNRIYIDVSVNGDKCAFLGSG